MQTTSRYIGEKPSRVENSSLQLGTSIQASYTTWSRFACVLTLITTASFSLFLHPSFTPPFPRLPLSWAEPMIGAFGLQQRQPFQSLVASRQIALAGPE